MRRVVVTGIGMVSPLGNDAKPAGKMLLPEKSGVSKDQSNLMLRFRPQIAGEVKGFEVEKYLPAKEAK